LKVDVEPSRFLGKVKFRAKEDPVNALNEMSSYLRSSVVF